MWYANFESTEVVGPGVDATVQVYVNRETGGSACIRENRLHSSINCTATRWLQKHIIWSKGLNYISNSANGVFCDQATVDHASLDYSLSGQV